LSCPELDRSLPPKQADENPFAIARGHALVETPEPTQRTVDDLHLRADGERRTFGQRHDPGGVAPRHQERDLAIRALRRAVAKARNQAQRRRRGEKSTLSA
jgi:hypothetical protein